MTLPTEKITSKLTRSNLDKIFTLVLMGNSVFGVVSVVLFFLSSWWIFLLLGTIGLPFVLGAFALFKYTSLREPMKRYGINFVTKVYEGIVQKRAGLLRRIYTAVCWFLPNNEWKNINWGYAKLNKDGNLIGQLEDLEEDKRFFVQLYHYIATGFGNWNLEGKNIVELRSGGAGGLSYVAKYLKPNLCIGVDESKTQTEAARENFKDLVNMKFYNADALDKISEVPELKDERIDLALSVQSSMHIRDFGNFVKEVSQIIRPGGFFAFTDMRLAEDWAQLEKELQGSDMQIMKKEDISNNVMLALKLDEVGKWKVISRKFGSIARRAVKRIGIIKDNALAESLAKGNNVAMAYILHKLPTRSVY